MTGDAYDHGTFPGTALTLALSQGRGDLQWCRIPFSKSPLVHHPSSEENQAPFPALAVTPETTYTSELQP